MYGDRVEIVGESIFGTRRRLPQSGHQFGIVIEAGSYVGAARRRRRFVLVDAILAGRWWRRCGCRWGGVIRGGEITVGLQSMPTHHG